MVGRLKAPKNATRIAPSSFHIPSRDERESLEIGRRVQLLFNFLNRDEVGNNRLRENVGDYPIRSR